MKLNIIRIILGILLAYTSISTIYQLEIMFPCPPNTTCGNNLTPSFFFIACLEALCAIAFIGSILRKRFVLHTFILIPIFIIYIFTKIFLQGRFVGGFELGFEPANFQDYLRFSIFSGLTLIVFIWMFIAYATIISKAKLRVKNNI